jgi:hypothetical protein
MSTRIGASRSFSSRGRHRRGAPQLGRLEWCDIDPRASVKVLLRTLATARRQTSPHREEPIMVAVLSLSPESLADPSLAQALIELAADEEHVQICAHETAPAILGAVRNLLPRHRVVALLVDGSLLSHERDLLEELLDVGHLPVVCVVGDPATAGVTESLGTGAARVLSSASTTA